MTRTKSLAGLALTCLALAGASSNVFGQTVTISTFDSDLRAFTETNFWRTGDSPQPTAIVWTNSDGGSMLVVNDWGTTTSWQDRKCQADVDPFPGYDLRNYGYVEFDAKVLADISGTNSPGGNSGTWGGIQVVGQGWDGAGDNTNVQWTTLGTITLTSAWAHYQVSTINYPHWLNRLTINFYNNPANTNAAMQTSTLIDNVKLTAPPIPPPRLQYVNAVRGLNIWQTGSQFDRNSFSTYQDGSGIYRMWAGNGAASYSFTVASFPKEAMTVDKGGISARLMLVPSPTGLGSPDWNEPNCIMMDLGVDTNGIASWIFRWKTNAPGSNGGVYTTNTEGSYYAPGYQRVLTNPTPLGKWTLSFSDDQHVTMTAPGGNSTNFILGVTEPLIPDISPAFVEAGTNQGEVYLGIFGGGTNNGDQLVVFSGAQLSGFITQVSNNWLAESTIDPSQWVRIANAPYALITATNAKWVNWNIPDTGFKLQTNTVNVGISNDWSTNHGLPQADIYSLHKGVLVKPTDLPASPRLFFRLSNPGY